MEAQQRRRYRARPRGQNAKPENGLREMLLSQCIVSAIVLVIALGISFLPLQFAREIRAGIKLALSQESSAESLLEAAGGVTEKYNEIKTSIKSIFGGTQEFAEAPVEDVEAIPIADVEQTQTVDAEQMQADDAEQESDIDIGTSSTDAWIDENVLRSINSGDYYEVNGGEKK